MTGRLLPPGQYGHDAVQIGDRIETGWAEITAAMIDRFADLTGDHFAIHMSDTGAQARGFARRVAHGLLVLSVVDGLKNQTPAQFHAIASLGWDWSFRKPVLAGDRIHAEIRVETRRVTQRGDRGILGLAFDVRNHEGEIVQLGHNRLMVHR